MMSSAPAPRCPTARRAWRWLAAVAVAWLVAGCGGSQVEEFDAQRLFVFGDEMSTINADGTNGRKYTINGLTSTAERDCRLNPLWVQSVASQVGLVFAECNPGAVTPAAFMRATPGARVADVTAALAAYAGGRAARDLVTVAVGLHDVLDVYAGYNGSNEAALAAELESRGNALATAINGVVRLGGPVVLVATVIDVGKTPYARAEDAAVPGRAALLTRLAQAFNSGLRLGIVNDGRVIGLVDAFEQVQAMVSTPSSYGLTNVTGVACNSAATWPDTSPATLLDCTSATLVSGATNDGWLWADLLRLAPRGQARLGSVALSRLSNNPF
ncbi:SGNH/GDSL hydrolase family protein [Azohydromonas sediminis]|uniref:SGNH/GDSL hydrolase family protein n=1 Tax=Azohydromonas sediminis TaxID=2259674 RepID=UPI000E64EC24|nr:SGNH/GDSL hydrolase family protein [Azohydromonas sediminis]